MFFHLTIHHPKSGAEKPLAESMQRFGAALKGAPGLVNVYTLEDKDAGTLVGLAIWESKEAMQASIHLAREAVQDDPFDEWEGQEVEGFQLTEV